MPINKKATRCTVFLPALVASVALIGVGCSHAKPDRPVTPNTDSTAQTSEAVFGAPTVLTVGTAARYPDGLRVQLVRVDDSRCPANAVCVWQGELAPLLRLSGGTLSAEREVRLGTDRAIEATAESYAIALREATTETATLVIGLVTTTGGCQKTGCSSQICSEQEVVSSCVYQPEYDCYKTATCELQADGKCGWTRSPALETCLAEARNTAPPNEE